jgi:protease secretion system outer membrane protein
MIPRVISKCTRVHVSRALIGCLLSLSVSQSTLAMDLMDAWQLSIRNDPNYLAGQAMVKEAEAGTNQALGGFLPSIAVSSSRYRADTFQETGTLLGPRQTNSQYTGRNDAITLRQPLFRYERFASYKQARAQEEGALASSENERQSLAQRLSAAYLDVLAALDNRNLVNAQKAAYDGQLAAAVSAFENGSGTRIDIDDARAKRDMVAASLIDVENLIDHTRRSLESIIGEPVQAELIKPLQAGRHLTFIENKTLEEWTEHAVRVSPEIKAAEEQLKAAEYEVEKVRANHLPSVDLVASRSRADSDTLNTIGQYSDTKQVGIQMTIPLFAGGQVIAGMDMARARSERSRQALEAARRKLAVMVGKAHDGARVGLSKILAASTAVESANTAVQSTRKGMQAGTRSQNDALNAEQQLALARRDLARARYDYLLSQISLECLAGVPAESVIEQFNTAFVR